MAEKLLYAETFISTERILLTKENVVSEIYQITCTITNKSYIGQTVSHVLNHGKYRRYGSQKRFDSHISEAVLQHKPKQCGYLNNAIRKYGKENFEVKCIGICFRQNANEWEQTRIEYYKTLYPNGYNLLSGGKQFIPTEKSRENVSKGMSEFSSVQRLNKFINVSIPQDIEIEKLIHPLKRENKQIGYYVYYKERNKDRIKSEFGGVCVPLEVSYQRAIDFIDYLKANANK